MQHTVNQGLPFSRLLAVLKTTFKVFIACENQAGFFQARKVQEQVGALCSDEIDISEVFWNFALFRHEGLREHALTEATEADMIVISLAGSNELPDHVKQWVDHWPVRAQAGQAALVILVGADQETWAERKAQVAYFRRRAEICGLDFFCNRDGWERPELGKSVTPRNDSSQPAPANNIIFGHLPWDRGGLND